jgi:hypothetical protein
MDKDSKFVQRLFIINTHKGYNRMKKVLQALAVLAVVATFFASCKSRENCPAYGKAEVSEESRF